MMGEMAKSMASGDLKLTPSCGDHVHLSGGTSPARWRRIEWSPPVLGVVDALDQPVAVAPAFEGDVGNAQDFACSAGSDHALAGRCCRAWHAVCLMWR